MRNPWQVLMVFGLVALIAGVGRAEPPAGEPSRPAPRPIPGVTAADPFPRGCVDCHVDRPDLGMDVRLSTGLRKWQEAVPPALLAKAQATSPGGAALEGRHPALAGELARTQIPSGCLTCHSRASKAAPPFARLLHSIHLGGGAQNHFVTTFQAECTHCHKLDRATGSWSLGGGAEQP